MKKQGIDILEELVHGHSSIESTSHIMHEKDKAYTHNRNAVDEFLLRVKNACEDNS